MKPYVSQQKLTFILNPPATPYNALYLPPSDRPPTILAVGRGWEAYPGFEELTACTNFDYVTASYGNYPGLYKRMTVFVPRPAWKAVRSHGSRP